MWYLIVNGKKQGQAFYLCQAEDIERTAFKALKEAGGIGEPRETTSPHSGTDARYFHQSAIKRGVVLQVVARPVDDACERVNLL